MERKKIIKNIFESLIIFIIVFIYNTFFYATYDHIIDFTHCFSIAEGLYIYKDFNIVIGPVYPLFIAFFLKIFGNNILVFDIINSLIVVAIYYLIKKHNNNTRAFLIIVLLHGILVAKYNTFTLLLFYLVYFLEDSNYKYKDYIIGFFIALSIFTKINVGVFLIFPTIILHFKEIKIILKRFLSLFLTSIFIIFSMYIFKVLPDFINYTVLGLFDFANSSSSAHKNGITSIVVVLFLAILYLMYNYKYNKKVVYIFFYLAMAYPSFDYAHVMLAVFPTLVYFIDKLKHDANTEKLSYIISLVFFIFSLTYNFQMYNTAKIDCKNKYCSQNYIFNKSFDNVHYLNEKLENKYDDYEIFYFNYFAYFFKLDLKQDINKYDFIWEGNLGFNGEEKYISEVKEYCSENKCLFIIDNNNITKREHDEKISLKILNFVSNSYQKVESFDPVSIYTNDSILNN